MSDEPPPAANDDTVWVLRLYIAGQTPRSLTALSNLIALCEKHLPNRHRIEITDLLQDPELADEDQIIAIPTLIRKRPPPVRKIVGDLSNTERVLASLHLVRRE